MEAQPVDGLCGLVRGFSLPESPKGKTSAYENIEVAENDNSVYLTGFVKKQNLEGMTFKSYGNVPDGVALVEKIKLDKLKMSTSPAASSSGAFTWTRTFPSFSSSKAARVVEVEVGG